MTAAPIYTEIDAIGLAAIALSKQQSGLDAEPCAGHFDPGPRNFKI